MSLTIKIDGINVHGKHGVYDQEKKEGQEFKIDVVVNLKPNIINFDNYKSESFDNTVNYEDLVNDVIQVSENNSFDLIETFAYEILSSFKKYKNIFNAKVTIHKPNSPLKEFLDDLSVTVSEEF
tara:strand:+ start:179 stop:550 length:372 start_codon:yes stop_codon:yes gene_type:complete